MTQKELFGQAKWISADDENVCPVLRQTFELDEKPDKAELRILGLGTFVAYLNGKRIGEDYFLPLSSDYEPRELSPAGEETAHRIYVPQYNVRKLLQKGLNTLTVFLGNGWYSFPTDPERSFGCMKALWHLEITAGKKAVTVDSDTDVEWHKSFVAESNLLEGEKHDFSDWDDSCLDPSCTEGWQGVRLSLPVVSDYLMTDCPADREISRVRPKELSNSNGTIVYDAYENTSAIVRVRLTAAAGETVTVIFGEELEDGEPAHGHGQRFVCVSDGKGRVAEPMFTWLAFRYIKITGGVVEEVIKIHADVPVTAQFESDEPMLDWIWKTFQNTMLSNMHRGIPSDCPHLERRGYTGDGQLTCKTVMMTMDAKAFYKKWLGDIADCQDRNSGHVQYTAPYIRSGGGPGGWGGAIIIVPYVYYRMYGDKELLRDMYPQMLQYIEYLEEHTKNMLVSSDKSGEWCLGEWCTPDDVLLPPPFVNNYFYIKCLELLQEITEILVDSKAALSLQVQIEKRKDAITAAYFDSLQGDFLGNRQGANGFALDIGLGDERTREHFLEHYRKEPWYDTGIFGTEIVTRLLFEYGEAETAVRMLCAGKPHGFGRWRDIGATTFWEYWLVSRSHNHPMFGAVVENLFSRILGIRQPDGVTKYQKLVIAPVCVSQVHKVSGNLKLPCGKVAVSYQRDEETVNFDISIPPKTEAMLLWQGQEVRLEPGENKLSLEARPGFRVYDQRIVDLVHVVAGEIKCSFLTVAVSGKETGLDELVRGETENTWHWDEADGSELAPYLERLYMAAPSDVNFDNKGTVSKLNGALRYYLNKKRLRTDAKSALYAAKLCCLCKKFIDPDVSDLCIKLLSRYTLVTPGNGNMKVVGSAGAGLVLRTVLYAALVNDPDIMDAARKALGSLTDEKTPDGIQTDASYLLKGKRQSGSDGVDFTIYMGELAFILGGTCWKFSEHDWFFLTRHILDGQRSMIAGRDFDPFWMEEMGKEQFLLEWTMYIPTIFLLGEQTEHTYRTEELKAFFYELSNCTDERRASLRYFPKAGSLTCRADGRYIGVHCLSQSPYAGVFTSFMHQKEGYISSNSFRKPGTVMRPQGRKNTEKKSMSRAISFGQALGSYGILCSRSACDGIDATVSCFLSDKGLVVLGACDGSGNLNAVIEERATELVKFSKDGATATCDSFRYKSLLDGVKAEYNLTPISDGPDGLKTFTATVPLRDGKYAYEVYFTGGKSAFKRILRNDGECQAIQLSDGTVMAAFVRDGEIKAAKDIYRGKAGQCLIFPQG